MIAFLVNIFCICTAIYQYRYIAKLRAQRDEAIRIAEEAQRIAREALGLTESKPRTYDIKIFSSHLDEAQMLINVSDAAINYGHQNKEAN